MRSVYVAVAHGRSIGYDLPKPFVHRSSAAHDRVRRHHSACRGTGFQARSAAATTPASASVPPVVAAPSGSQRAVPPAPPAPPSPAAGGDLHAVEQLNKAYRLMSEQLAKVIVGQHEVIEQVLTAMFCQGPILPVGVPGLAKTLLVKTISDVLN